MLRARLTPPAARRRWVLRVDARRACFAPRAPAAGSSVFGDLVDVCSEHRISGQPDPELAGCVACAVRCQARHFWILRGHWILVMHVTGWVLNAGRYAA